MGEIVTALVAAAVAIVGSAASAIVAHIRLQQTRKEFDGIKQIIKDSNQLYFVTCPNCGTKIYLNNVNISTKKKEE